MIDSTTMKKKTKLRWPVKPLLIVAIIFLAIPALTAGGLAYIEEPDFCGTCHSMEKHYESWNKSGHSEISCYNCHADLEVQRESENEKTKNEELVPRYMLTTNKVVRTFGKTVEALSGYSEAAGNYVDKKQQQVGFIFNIAFGNYDQADKKRVWDRCLNCHGDLMFSEKGNDHYGHFKHAGNGVISCRECHGNLVHGKKVKVERKQCLKCHDEEINSPPSHQIESFQATHGKDYIAKKNCTLCHVQGTKEKLCLDCHKLEMPHPKNYKERHIEAISEVGTRNCFNCHETKVEIDPDNPDQSGESASCKVCHGQEMPHEKNILKEHTTLAKEEGIKSCNNCHKSKPEQKDMAIACVDCHGIEMPHPQGFKFRHKDAFYAKGRAVCNLCHSPMNRVNPLASWARPNFCDECHMRNKPHPKGFGATHQLGGYNWSGCNVCHPREFQEHCNTFCHFGE